MILCYAVFNFFALLHTHPLRFTQQHTQHQWASQGRFRTVPRTRHSCSLICSTSLHTPPHWRSTAVSANARTSKSEFTQRKKISENQHKKILGKVIQWFFLSWFGSIPLHSASFTLFHIFLSLINKELIKTRLISTTHLIPETSSSKRNFLFLKDRSLMKSR